MKSKKWAKELKKNLTEILLIIHSVIGLRLDEVEANFGSIVTWKKGGKREMRGLNPPVLILTMGSATEPPYYIWSKGQNVKYKDPKVKGQCSKQGSTSS